MIEDILNLVALIPLVRNWSIPIAEVLQWIMIIKGKQW